MDSTATTQAGDPAVSEFPALNAMDETQFLPNNASSDAVPRSDPNPSSEMQPQPDSEKMRIVIRDAHGAEVQYIIKKTTPLRRAINAFSLSMGKSATTRFLFDGTTIGPSHTATDVSHILKYSLY